MDHEYKMTRDYKADHKKSNYKKKSQAKNVHGRKEIDQEENYGLEVFFSPKKLRKPNEA